MERRFGKDFIDKMNSQKEEFERLQKELEEAKSFVVQAREFKKIMRETK